jgi:hypothetical protein
MFLPDVQKERMQALLNETVQRQRSMEMELRHVQEVWKNTRTHIFRQRSWFLLCCNAGHSCVSTSNAGRVPCARAEGADAGALGGEYAETKGHGVAIAKDIGSMCFQNSFCQLVLRKCVARGREHVLAVQTICCILQQKKENSWDRGLSEGKLLIEQARLRKKEMLLKQTEEAKVSAPADCFCCVKGKHGMGWHPQQLASGAALGRQP